MVVTADDDASRRASSPPRVKVSEDHAGAWADDRRDRWWLAQTLKEQVLWIERFDTLERLRARVRQFTHDFNEHWLLERHGYRSPRQGRAALTSQNEAVA